MYSTKTRCIRINLLGWNISNFPDTNDFPLSEFNGIQLKWLVRDIVPHSKSCRGIDSYSSNSTHEASKTLYLFIVGTSLPTEQNISETFISGSSLPTAKAKMCNLSIRKFTLFRSAFNIK